VSGRAGGARTRAAVGLLACVGVLTACVPNQATTDGDDVIAFLLPESKTSRYETLDRPMFVDAVEENCPECRVIYANAGQDARRQQAQAESALSQGAEVLVLDPVDSVAARGIVEAAEDRGVAVIAYDRFISQAPLDYYVAYDAGRVGQIQGAALIDALSGRDLEPGEGVLLVHGAPTDSNAAEIKTGLQEALWGSGIPVLAEFDTPDWSPDASQQWVEGQLSQFGDRVVGVYAANDGTAAGAISAMRAAGMFPVPPVTGQDAELAAIQRIVSGDQLMTVYKRIGQEARLAASIAVRLLRGETPTADLLVDGVPSRLLMPVEVTRDDIRSVIVDGGVFTVDQICTPAYEQACRELGLLEEER
jgi:D-xylose transport system substrate-binding protein